MICELHEAVQAWSRVDAPMYVPFQVATYLPLHKNRHLSAKALNIARVECSQYLPLENLIQTGNHFLFVADDGMGKTTLLRYLYQKQAETYLTHSSDQPYPFWLRLDTCSRIHDFKRYLEELCRETTYMNLLRNKQLNLFMDGIDQVDADDRQGVFDAIEWFHWAFPDAGLYLSGSLSIEPEELTIPMYQIMPLGNRDVQDLFTRKGKRDLHDAYVSLPSTLRLFNNPQLLSLVCGLPDSSMASLPRNRVELMQTYLRYLKQNYPSVSASTWNEGLAICGLMAQEMFRKRYVSLTMEQVRSLLPGDKPFAAVQEALYPMIDSGLLVEVVKEDGDQRIAFATGLYQSYFAARQKFQTFGMNPHTASALTSLHQIRVHSFYLSMLATDPMIQKALPALLTETALLWLKKHDFVYFNNFLADLFELIGEAHLVNADVHNWACQYAMLSMDNYVKLDRELQKQRRLHMLCSALAILDDPQVNSLILRSRNRLQYWLYQVGEEGDYDLNARSGQMRQLFLLFSCCSDRVAVWYRLEELKESMGFISAVTLTYILMRIKGIQEHVVKSMRSDELQRIYMETGDINMLLMSNDTEFILREFQEKNLAQELKMGLREFSPEAILNFYKSVLPKLDPAEVNRFLRLDNLPQILMRVPGLEDILMDEANYKTFHRVILMSCLRIPLPNLSKNYKAYIEKHRDQLCKKPDEYLPFLRREALVNGYVYFVQPRELAEETSPLAVILRDVDKTASFQKCPMLMFRIEKRLKEGDERPEQLLQIPQDCMAYRKDSQLYLFVYSELIPKMKMIKTFLYQEGDTRYEVTYKCETKQYLLRTSLSPQELYGLVPASLVSIEDFNNHFYLFRADNLFDDHAKADVLWYYMDRLTERYAKYLGLWYRNSPTEKPEMGQVMSIDPKDGSIEVRHAKTHNMLRMPSWFKIYRKNEKVVLDSGICFPYLKELHMDV